LPENKKANDIESRMPHPIPTPAEREVLFSWLKRASSLGAWNRLFRLNKTFVDAVEKTYADPQSNTPRPDGSFEHIPTDWMSWVFACHDAFRVALDRLRDGDRRCFLFLGAKGHFNEGIAAVRWWRDMYNREIYMGGGKFSPAYSPAWPEIDKTIDAALAGVNYVSIVLQQRHTDVPAPIRYVGGLNAPGFWASLVRHVSHDAVLAAVPAYPEPAICVKTGQTVPVFGIWEPVAASGQGRYQLDGCMNYLHAGFPAPTIDFPEDGQRGEGRPTLWRLIWADTRYGLNPVPPEEETYVFDW
jgi:hypothetical protein